LNIILWLYNTIPFIQLYGKRANIVGFLWLVCLTFITYAFLPRINPFKNSSKKTLVVVSLVFLNLIVSALIVYTFHQYFDYIFQVVEVATHPSMITGNAPSWSWLTYWFGLLWRLILLSLILLWIFKTYGLGKFLSFNRRTLIASILVVSWWIYFLTYYPYDYAALAGEQRIIVFWATYPELYILYGILYLSFWNFKYFRAPLTILSTFVVRVANSVDAFRFDRRDGDNIGLSLGHCDSDSFAHFETNDRQFITKVVWKLSAKVVGLTHQKR